MAKSKAAPRWHNRIVGHDAVPPESLLPNPKNPRRHPRAQRDALLGVLREVGVVQDVIVNRTTGRLVDGHLRVALAVQEGQTTIPVTYVDLTADQEALILATFDPLGALAELDAECLAMLLREVQSGEEAVQVLLQDLAAQAGAVPPAVEFKEYGEEAADDVAFIECPQCGHRWPR